MKRGRLLARISSEFALVIAGVLAALWVNDWHQDRQDREAEAGLLTRMEAELAADGADLATAEYRARGRLWVLDAVLARLGDREAESRLSPARLDSILRPPRLDSIAALTGRRSPVIDLTVNPLAPFRQRGNFDLSKATYEEMLATGRVRLVEDDEVRATIMNYYQLAADIGANEDRDPYYEQLEDAFASIDVAFGDSLGLDELAERGRRVASFPVSARRARNRIQALIRYYDLVEGQRGRLEGVLARYRTDRDSPGQP